MKAFSKERLSNVEVYLGEPNEAVRDSMRGVIRDYGMRRVRAFSRMPDLIKAVQESPPDLLIAADDISEGLFDAVRDIRHFKIGRNPFLMISLMVRAEREGALKRAVLAGADDVVVKPVAPGKVLERLAHLTMNRLPFIVTNDYLGPERRRPDDARRSQIRQLSVVNTLRAKVEGRRMTAVDIAQAVQNNMTQVMSARLESHGLKLGWVCAWILRAYHERRIDIELKDRLLLLVDVLENAARTAANISEPELSRLCTDMARQVEEMAESYEAPSSLQLATIQKLTKAFEMAKSATSARPGAASYSESDPVTPQRHYDT